MTTITNPYAASNAGYVERVGAKLIPRTGAQAPIEGETPKRGRRPPQKGGLRP